MLQIKRKIFETWFFFEKKHNRNVNTVNEINNLQNAPIEI